MVINESFISGKMHILIIIKTPTIPTAFFKINPHPKTESTASPNIFPTIGIAELTTAFVVFADIPSTLLDNVPSNEITATNIVRTIPKIHVTLDFISLDSLSICILSDILEIIVKLEIAKTTGINIFWIKFAINSTPKIIVGCNILVVVMLPRKQH